jgi:hypothetical protein
MEPLRAHDQPSQVVAEQGTVIIEGPAGAAITMTPDAAEETARRLLAAVADARAQPPGAAAEL